MTFLFSKMLKLIYVFLDNEYYYCKLSIYLVLEPSTQI